MCIEYIVEMGHRHVTAQSDSILLHEGLERRLVDLQVVFLFLHEILEVVVWG